MRNRHLYPKNWDEISRAIRDRANWRCEQCGKPCRKPGESWDYFRDRLGKTRDALRWWSETYEVVDDEEFGMIEIPKPTRFTLTVAHLDHDPVNCALENLKALCAPCHLRYDARDNAKRQAKTRAKKKAERDQEIGQMELFSPASRSNY
jgi:hypothetical protein